MATINKTILILVSSLMLLSCRPQSVYSHYEAIPEKGWASEQTLTYEYTIDDTTALYQVLLHIRHTENYAYQNLWLFVDNDTMDITLADERGNWIGSGRNGILSLPVLYQDSVQLTAGKHEIHIQQGMRETLLTGIKDVGVEIKKQ